MVRPGAAPGASLPHVPRETPPWHALHPTGKLHFKTKFCANCRRSVLVPAQNVRAISAAQSQFAHNRRSEGFWNYAPPELGSVMYRVVNNTVTCHKPWLAIYRETPPPLAFAPLPEEWVENGYVRMCVARGTLAPVGTIRSNGAHGSGSKRQRFDSEVHARQCEAQAPRRGS